MEFSGALLETGSNSSGTFIRHFRLESELQSSFRKGLLNLTSTATQASYTSRNLVQEAVVLT